MVILDRSEVCKIPLDVYFFKVILTLKIFEI
jgi:hypothetical protein